MPVQCTCRRCGQPFSVPPSRAQSATFCSMACMASPVTCTCQQCGEAFSATPARIGRGRGKYCSRRCRGLAQRTGDKYIKAPDGSEHRAVWERVHGTIPPGYVIHHINGDKRDNRLENLAMMTTEQHGSLHAQRKLTAEEVTAIRTKYARGGTSYRGLARDYGIDQRTVQEIVRRLTWRHTP